MLRFVVGSNMLLLQSVKILTPNISQETITFLAVFDLYVAWVADQRS